MDETSSRPPAQHKKTAGHRPGAQKSGGQKTGGREKTAAGAEAGGARGRLPENRRVALKLLQSVLREKKPLDDQIDALCRGLDGRDRGFVRQVVSTTLRRIGEIDTVINRCLDRKMPAKLADVRDVLRLSVAQMLFLHTPAHAVVDTAVELIKESRLAPYSGLANAVLRRLAREGDELLAGVDGQRLNTPRWLWMEWVEAWGEPVARALGDAHTREAPLDLTLKNPQEADRWAELLEADILPGGSLRRRAAVTGLVPELPGYDEGAWWVQDAAAAIPVRLLGDVRGQAVLDLCAAPGGKTCQLAAAGAVVTALDRSARRLRRVSENLARLGLTAQVIDADAIVWRPETLADAVLLDAPCSATGTLRRHPDVARVKRADDVTALMETQAALIQAALSMVRPGGLVVYCTCSLQPGEGERQIEAALAASAAGGLPCERVPVTAEETGGDASLVSAAGDVRTMPCHWPERGGLDGFFAARLRRL